MCIKLGPVARIMRYARHQSPRLLRTLAILLAGVLLCSGTTIEDIEAKNSTEVDYQTPHTKYGRTLAGGRFACCFS